MQRLRTEIAGASASGSMPRTGPGRPGDTPMNGLRFTPRIVQLDLLRRPPRATSRAGRHGGAPRYRFATTTLAGWLRNSRRHSLHRIEDFLTPEHASTLARAPTSDVDDPGGGPATPHLRSRTG